MSDLDIPEFLKRDAGWKDWPMPSPAGSIPDRRGERSREGAKKRFPKEKFEARKALAAGARWDARNNKWVHDPKPVYAHADSVKVDGKNWFEWAQTEDKNAL